MQTIMDQLAKLGKEINQAKTNVSQLGGQRIEIVKRLSEDFAITTLPEVEELIKKYDKNLAVIEQEIVQGFEELKKEFSW